jgi:D-3-phosphoglycerate dehydrogenase
MPHVVLVALAPPRCGGELRAEPGFTVETVQDTSRENLVRAMAEAEAIVVRATPINADFLSFSPKLALVARHGVGYDQVDVAELSKRGIPLTVTADANALSVAEHALMLMLNVARATKQFDANTREFKWSTTEAPVTWDLAG